MITNKKDFKVNDIGRKYSINEVVEQYKVPAVNFIGTIMVNVNNEKLSDFEFRQFIRRTLPIVEKPLDAKDVSEKNIDKPIN
jgi:hypothetical protein